MYDLWKIPFTFDCHSIDKRNVVQPRLALRYFLKNKVWTRSKIAFILMHIRVLFRIEKKHVIFAVSETTWQNVSTFF